MYNLLEKLKETTVLVVGCGGLGGYVIEQLARCNIHRLIICDFDKFDKSNMNRQTYCNYNTLGQKKVDIAKAIVSKISETEVITIDKEFSAHVMHEYNNDIDVIVDCVDNIKARFQLESYASKIKVPLIHGSINGVIGQFTTIMPNTHIFKQIYKDKNQEILPTVACVPSMVASLQVAEVIKIVNNLPITEDLILVNMITNSMRKIKLK